MEQVSELPADGADVEPVTGSAPGSIHRLRSDVVSVVLGHRGVFRLEPTLAGLLHGGGDHGAGSAGGIVLSVRDRFVDVEVTISTRSGHRAFRTVTELQAQLSALLVRRGFVCDTVNIDVLSVETDD